MNLDNIPEHILKAIREDPAVRRRLAYDDHAWFFRIYLGEGIEFKSAPFHYDMFRLTMDDSVSLAAIVAFRGSAKSTIMGLSYPIWAITGIQQKKFILILTRTQNQARQYLSNTKNELAREGLLRQDLGPFEMPDDEWSSQSIVIPKYGARITVASADQSIRGIRHGAHRPDLIIADDVEDLASVRTQEGRDKTFNWFTGDVIGAGTQSTKIILIGNLLHQDSLLMRFKKLIDLKRLDGQFMSVPILREDGTIAWPGQFPTMEHIERYKRRFASEAAWLRECMLRIIADDDQVIPLPWIQYYDRIPDNLPSYRHTLIGVDLASSKALTADYTAMVAVEVYGRGKNLRAFVLPNPLNQRLSPLETTEAAKYLAARMRKNWKKPRFYVEEVGYQVAATQAMKQEGLDATGAKVHGASKRDRLRAVSYLVESGKVTFPRQGAELLITQITGLGTETKDDLADAFAIALQQIVEDNEPGGQMWIGRDPRSIRGRRRRGSGFDLRTLRNDPHGWD